jgi:putative hydrolase
MTPPILEIFPPGFISCGLEDVHVHTDRCNDASLTPEDAILESVSANLSTIVFTAHVRTDTALTPLIRWKRHIRSLSHPSSLTVLVSVETKLLTTRGDLDIPTHFPTESFDTMHIADHQIPSPEGPLTPRHVRNLLDEGALSETVVWEWVTQSLLAALIKYPGSIVAHPLSIFPKVGIDPQSMPEQTLDLWVDAIKLSGSVLEVNSKWNTPHAEMINACISSAVPVVSGSDAHEKGRVGDDAFLNAFFLTEQSDQR